MTVLPDHGSRKGQDVTEPSQQPTHLPRMVWSCEGLDSDCASEVSYPADMLGWYPAESYDEELKKPGMWLCDECAQHICWLSKHYSEWMTVSLRDWIQQLTLADLRTAAS